MTKKIDEFVESVYDVTGDSKNFLKTMFLVNISRNLGKLVVCNEYKQLKPRTNLFAVLVAPPAEFHKTSLIRQEDEISKEISNSLNDFDFMKDYFIDLGILPPELPEGKSFTFNGSPEGITELVKGLEHQHFKGIEFGRTLGLSSKNPDRYDSQIMILLNEMFYGKLPDHVTLSKLRDGAIDSNNGTDRFLTLFADLHPDELTADALKLGLLRRCILVKQHYKDIVVEDTIKAFSAENDKTYQKLRTEYINAISDYAANLISFGTRPNIVIDEKTGESKGEFEPLEVHISPEFIACLKTTIKQSSERVKEEEVPRYPSENPELIIRTAFNIMLLDNALNKTKITKESLTLKSKHFDATMSYLKDITEAYIEEVSSLVNPKFSSKVDAITSYVTKYGIRSIGEINRNYSWAKKENGRRELKAVLDFAIGSERLTGIGYQNAFNKRIETVFVPFDRDITEETAKELLFTHNIETGNVWILSVNMLK